MVGGLAATRGANQSPHARRGHYYTDDLDVVPRLGCPMVGPTNLMLRGPIATQSLPAYNRAHKTVNFLPPQITLPQDGGTQRTWKCHRGQPTRVQERGDMNGRTRRSRPANKSSRVLMSFVGRRDPFRADHAASGDGPLLSLLAVRTFSSVYLFYNNFEYHRRASAVLEELLRRSPEVDVSYVGIPVNDPTDYESLYEEMQHKALEIVERHGKESEYCIATASGTPQMQTCWLLLVLGGVIPARLLQVNPPEKVCDGESPVREICPSVDRFPKIVSPGKLKRELAIATRRAELLSKERAAMEREVGEGLIGTSKAFRDVIAAAKSYAEYNMPVLITGETGTGKEEIARLIHFSSSRREQPFLPINCAALPESLLESELFGHKKGAFSGAHEDKEGLLEAAGDGTVFLDEIGELALEGQAKLLRVLEGGRFRRVGETREMRCYARIVAATNRDLEAMVDQQQFREDLLFRLNVAEIAIPPLRERQEDIEALAQRFLEVFCRNYDRDMRFSPDALKQLASLPWRGNVRELKHAVERLVISHPANVVLPKHLEKPRQRKRATRDPLPQVQLGDSPIDLQRIIDEWERDLIEQAIQRFQGNRSAAARHLGYEEATLRKKARKYFGPKRSRRERKT